METFASVNLCLSKDGVFSLGLRSVVRTARLGQQVWPALVFWSCSLRLVSTLDLHLVGNVRMGVVVLCVYTHTCGQTPSLGQLKTRLAVRKREQWRSVVSAESVIPFVFFL